MADLQKYIKDKNKDIVVATIYYINMKCTFYDGMTTQSTIQSIRTFYSSYELAQEAKKIHESCPISEGIKSISYEIVPKTIEIIV